MASVVTEEAVAVVLAHHKQERLSTFPASRAPAPRAPAAPITVDVRNRDADVTSQIEDMPCKTAAGQMFRIAPGPRQEFRSASARHTEPRQARGALSGLRGFVCLAAAQTNSCLGPGAILNIYRAQQTAPAHIAAQSIGSRTIVS